MTDEKDLLMQPSLEGPPRVEFPGEPPDLAGVEGLCEEVLSEGEKTDASLETLHELVSRYPETLSGWVALGKIAHSRGQKVEAYAYFRVAYHRGLDKARASGWRGDGRIPWAFPSNRPFLSAIYGLMSCAGAIGETREAERCWDFLRMLDPDHPFKRNH